MYLFIYTRLQSKKVLIQKILMLSEILARSTVRTLQLQNYHIINNNEIETVPFVWVMVDLCY